MMHGHTYIKFYKYVMSSCHHFVYFCKSGIPNHANELQQTVLMGFHMSQN